MQIPLQKVPLEARRLAAQHLESVRHSGLVDNSGSLRLGTEALPVYRPDLEDVAYWEIPVSGRGERGPALRSRHYPADSPCGGGEGEGTRPGAIGFVVVSNGRHDFPIAHWSLDREPPSIQVGRDPAGACGEKERSEGVARRLYRLDSLSYVAEDEAGEICGQSGQIPALITGLPHNLARYAGRIASSLWTSRKGERSDEDAEKAAYALERSKDKPPELKRSDEGGWKVLKERYAESFGPLLDQLRERAARTWEIEDRIREFGEGIIAGETHRVALLGEACVEISGEGSKFVRATIEDDPPCLVLAADRTSLPHEMDLDVAVTYADGEREELRFFVVSRDVPSNTKADRASSCEEEG